MVTKYGIPPMASMWGRVVHQKILYVLFHLTLYIMLATCYFVPWIYLIPDNFTFYIHMAPVNARIFFYNIFLDIHKKILWRSKFSVRLSGTKFIFMAQNNMSPIYRKVTKKIKKNCIQGLLSPIYASNLLPYLVTIVTNMQMSWNLQICVYFP